MENVNHGDEGVMIQACRLAFAAAVSGQSTMNFSVFQTIIESNVRPSVRQLKLGRPTHNRKSTEEWLKKKRIKVF